MKELRKKIAIIAAISMLAASFAVVAAEDEKAETADTTVATTADTDAEADAEVTAEDETTADEAADEETEADATPVIPAALTNEEMEAIIAKVELEDGVNVIYKDAIIKFDVKPQIVEDRTLVPLRAIFEALGAEIEWDETTRTVTAVKDDITIVVVIGENKLTKNGEVVELDVAAQIVDDRTLVPLRAISESFGNLVDFDGATKTVIIRDVAEAPQADAADETAADETAADETAADETAADETAADETATDETATDEDADETVTDEK